MFFKKYKKEISNLRAENARLQKQCEDREAQIKKYDRQEIERLKEQWYSAGNHTPEYLNNLSKLRERNEWLQKQYNELSAQIKKCDRQEFNRINGQLRAANEQLRAANILVQKYSNEIATLKSESQKHLEKLKAEQAEKDIQLLEKLTRDSIKNAFALKSNPYIADSAVYKSLCQNYTSYQITRVSNMFDSNSEILDIKAMIEGTEDVYTTTLNNCTCPDYRSRKKPCKHMYRLAYELGLLYTMAEQEKLKNTDLRETILKIEELQDEEKKLFSKQIQIDTIIKQSKQSFPYLANLFAELERYSANLTAVQLREKHPPAIKAADEVSKLKRHLVKLRKTNKLLTHQLVFLLSIFPWLEEFMSVPPQEACLVAEYVTASDSAEEFESFKTWISPEEWKKLPDAEKYQHILDRYKTTHRKTKWELGIEYERYIGYKFEEAGYHVTYFGAINKLEDLGRDIIAKKDGKTIIVQCKRWNQHKVIHEKHIFQLYGTFVKYKIEHPDENVLCEFVSSCPLSPVALNVAKYLDVKVRDDEKYTSDYPMIKCNINNGKKIFHLPMDLQYDRIIIDKDSGEFYAYTVKEAMEKGFRRAYKWKTK